MIDQLIRSIEELQNPTVVGLDPRLGFIPEHIKEEAFENHGKTLEGASEAFYRFNKEIIDQIKDVVPAVKPQIAMYEQYGYAGIKAYMDTIQYAKDRGLIVIGDVKRGDIASTAKAYSDGHIGLVDIEGEKIQVFKEDFITLSPYLGYDSIEPYVEDLNQRNKGLFILVKTSNPNSKEIQDLTVEGELLYERVAKLLKTWGEAAMGELGYSRMGAVVGATHPKDAERIRKILPDTFFLVPGYGAQGATAEDLVPNFNKGGRGAIINSSRGIIAAYKNEKYQKDFGPKDFAPAARAAALDMKKDLQRVMD